MKEKRYWLRWAFLGALINFTYALVTLIIFPIGDCHTNDLCGLPWGLLNFHNFPIEYLLEPRYAPNSIMNTYLIPFTSTLITGFIFGLIAATIYRKIKNRKASV